MFFRWYLQLFALYCSERAGDCVIDSRRYWSHHVVDNEWAAAKESGGQSAHSRQCARAVCDRYKSRCDTCCTSSFLTKQKLLVHAPCHSTAGCVSVHPVAQCVVHALKGLACRAPVLLAHAEVTENIKYFSMGPKLRYPPVHAPCHSIIAISPWRASVPRLWQRQSCCACCCC